MGLEEGQSGALPNGGSTGAEDAAVEWILLLREQPGDAELVARFEIWLAASKSNRCAWADAAHAYDRAGEIRPSFAPPVRAAETKPVLPELPLRRTRRPGARRTSTWRRVVRPRNVAAIAASLCFAILAGPAILLRLEADHRTGTGEMRTVALADGSRVELAPDSAIAVTLGERSRKIRLLKGQAWFDVRRDEDRPFFVDAGGVTTTVLGTAFDVRLGVDGATTQLVRGKVRIDYAFAPPPISEQLVPGDSVRVGFDGGVTRSTTAPDQMAAWRSGEIIVRNRPAADVVDALRPWFSGVIVTRGRKVARERVTGVYHARDPEQALRALVRAYGGRVTTVTPWIIVVSDD